MKEKINLANFTNDPRGAVTVEYAIIFPIVIICILLLIYLGMLYYQQCLMQTVVSENVQSLALLWGYELDGADVKTGITSKDAYISEKLYWHIAQETNEKKIKAAQSIQNEIMLKSIIKPQNDFEVEVKEAEVVEIVEKLRPKVQALNQADIEKIEQEEEQILIERSFELRKKIEQENLQEDNE